MILRTPTLLLATVAAFACTEVERVEVPVDAPRDMPPVETGEPADPLPAEAALKLDNGARIDAFLEGKTLTMTGADIPTEPNGIDENRNAGQATQCINRTEMRVSSGAFSVSTTLAVLDDAPELGTVGTCNREAPAGNALSFASTHHLVENVQGNAECFDFTITYPGFAQEGRGKIEPDGSVIYLELFFKDTAVGHRCGDGAIGELNTVTLNGAAFSGNAVQVYRVSETR